MTHNTENNPRLPLAALKALANMAGEDQTRNYLTAVYIVKADTHSAFGGKGVAFMSTNGHIMGMVKQPWAEWPFSDDKARSLSPQAIKQILGMNTFTGKKKTEAAVIFRGYGPESQEAGIDENAVGVDIASNGEPCASFNVQNEQHTTPNFGQVVPEHNGLDDCKHSGISFGAQNIDLASKLFGAVCSRNKKTRAIELEFGKTDFCPIIAQHNTNLMQGGTRKTYEASAAVVVMPLRR